MTRLTLVLIWIAVVLFGAAHSIADCGLRTANRVNRQSIRNPQSAIRNYLIGGLAPPKLRAQGVSEGGLSLLPASNPSVRTVLEFSPAIFSTSPARVDATLLERFQALSKARRGRRCRT